MIVLLSTVSFIHLSTSSSFLVSHMIVDIFTVRSFHVVIYIGLYFYLNEEHKTIYVTKQYRIHIDRKTGFCRIHYHLISFSFFYLLLFLISFFCILYFVFQNTEIDPTLFTIIRSAFIGLCASSISDICSNSLRVLKTTKQTAGIETVEIVGDTPINNLSVLKTVQRNTNDIEIVTGVQNVVKAEIPGDNVKISNMVIEDNTTAKNTKIEPKSYIEIAKDIIAVDGIGGLLGRGLQVDEKIRC